PEGDPVDHPRPGLAPTGTGVLEEGHVETGRALVVTVEQVVDVGVVLVDRLGHQAHPQNPGVEVEVGRCVAGYRRNVMDAIELHRAGSGEGGGRILTTAGWGLTSRNRVAGPETNKARRRKRRRALELPLLGSNQDSPDPESGVLPVTPRGSVWTGQISRGDAPAQSPRPGPSGHHRGGIVERRELAGDARRTGEPARQRLGGHRAELAGGDLLVQ